MDSKITAKQQNYLETFQTLRLVKNYLPNLMLQNSNPAYQHYIPVKVCTHKRYKRHNNNVT